MVIYNCNVSRTIVRAGEADSVLIVNSYGVLSLAVALESFETVARWYSQILKVFGRVQHAQLAHENLGNAGEWSMVCTIIFPEFFDSVI